MTRLGKPLLVAASVLFALLLTVTRSTGPRGTVGIGAGATGVAAQVGKGDKSGPYDLASLRVFKSTLMRVNDAYVDPTRVEPRQMLLSALDQVQKSVAEVLVEPHKEQSRVTVRVDTAQQEFDISTVDSPWALATKMSEVFGFISKNLPSDTERDQVRNIEYAATNGMLSTLDPHSVLLDPTLYNEMKMTTRGSFGGLGIVVGIRNGHLTVIRPMPDTPAGRAGIKKGDRIVRIDKLSTMNMMLQDAVGRLRGDPDTKVELWIEKASEKGAQAKKVVLTRAIIQVKTVEAHLLDKGVGYVKLYQSFGGNTVEEMKKALEELKTKGMKSLVLDLRSNPGGLLDQAIKVTDEFVESGTIVTTVGYANKQREEKRASPGAQPHFPMAVLVNRGSASASEIVAGALKNLDRAVVIGTRTFGKGSVQVLYDNDDGSALKLTIAQYLTPGDISIQSVGITPDIQLEKVAVDKDKGVSLYRDYKGMSEAELESHLVSKNVRTEDKPQETLKYLAADAPKAPAKALLRDDDKKDDSDGEPELDDEEDLAELDDSKFQPDYEIQFARDLVAQAKGWKRHELLAGSKSFFEQKAAGERARIVESLKKLGIDWNPVGAGPVPELTATLSTDRPKHEAAADSTLTFTATVTATGSGTAGQLRGVLRSGDFLFEGREFMFGRVAAGETRSFSVPVKVPKGALSRTDLVRLELFEEHGAKVKVDGDGLVVTIAGLPRPVFSYSYQLIDDVKGNGDGLVQRGESVRLRVTVKNIGLGKSSETWATLRNLSDEGLDIVKGRFKLDALAPGETRSADFTFDLKSDYRPETFKMELSVYDGVLQEYISEKLGFTLAAPLNVTTEEGVVTVGNEASVYGAPDKSGVVVGTAAKGAQLKLTGTLPGFYRVEVEAGRPAFLPTDAGTRTPGVAPKLPEVAAASAGAAATGAQAPFAASWQVSPPRLELQPVAGLLDQGSVRLSGAARDDRKVADVFIFVSNRQSKIERRKVFYRSNRNGPNPGSMAFDAEVPLWPGANVVTVVARENSQVTSQQTLVIERRGPQVASSGAAAAPPDAKR
jgi:carboxyl-terminal processing protease